MYNSFNLGPYLHVTIFCLTILPFLQRIPSYATESVVHNLSLYINQDCRDFILNTNHGFTKIATVRLDERGDSYFGTGLWKEISKFYVLKVGTKIALHIEGPGHEIYANFPKKSSVHTLFEVSFLFSYLHMLTYPAMLNELCSI